MQIFYEVKHILIGKMVSVNVRIAIKERFRDMVLAFIIDRKVIVPGYIDYHGVAAVCRIYNVPCVSDVFFFITCDV